MSFDAYARDPGVIGDFTDLVDAANKGLLTAPKKRGLPPCGPGVKQRLSQIGVMASLLATEGCLTLGDEAGPITDDEGSVPPPAPPPSSVQAVDDADFHVDTSGELYIAPQDLLANDAAPAGATLEIVRVYGATNGQVTLIDGLVHFTPAAGYEGMASFFYEVRDSNGNLSQASVEIHVGPQDHDDHGSGGDEDHSGVHPDDPDKAAEHMALMELVPASETTHVAVQNGSWFDPATWENGVIPGEGAKVLIPEGVEVAYDGESAVSLFTVRVDGALEFATDKDTFMEVDTLVVTPNGRLTIGTADNPVAANVETVIQIADNGPIDVEWDPMLLSRGVVSHGAIEIHGAYKDAFLQVAVDPMKGDTSMKLESIPEGWQVGDKLVLTGTHLTETDYAEPTQPHHHETEDEELIITQIIGDTVYFDRPLQYDHEGARSDLKAYVANYTRNVRFETENADAIPVHQRGHVMLMHSDDIDVRYAEFSELGRTDKSERSFNVADLDQVESDSNVQGRYSLHVHRVGVSDPDDPAMLVGNAVWGSPGWGFVHHDSNAVFADNAAYDTFGAGFVAETGNEIGRWVHNISIKTIGTGGGPKWHEDVDAFDLARTGANFWFQGRLVDSVDNVAAGSPGGHGFVYMSRGNGMIDVTTATADFPETLHYYETALVNQPHISQFEGNEAIAVRVGLEVIKGGPQQGHDARTMIDDFLAWEVANGVHLQYTAHYTLKDIDVIGSSQKGGGIAGQQGISYGTAAFDLVVDGAKITGFEQGIAYTKLIVVPDDPIADVWDYVFIDVAFAGNGENMPDFDPLEDLLLNSADIPNYKLSLNPDFDDVFTAPNTNWDSYLTLSGTKTDSLGSIEISPEADPVRFRYLSIQGALADEGYWTLPDGRVVAQVEQYFSDRVTGEIEKMSRWVYWTDKIEPSWTYNGVLDLDDDAAPVAQDDLLTTGVEERAIIDVLANDSDPDGDGIRVDGIVQASHGHVSLNDDGTLSYAPDPNFSGTDEFWYWVEDDNGNFHKGHVAVTVEI